MPGSWRTNLPEIMRGPTERPPWKAAATLDRIILVALVLVVILAACPSQAFGEEASEPEPPRRAVIAHEGAPGFWFRRDVALEMLADLRELPIRQRELALLNEQLELREGQVERLREMVGLEREAVERSLEAVEAAERRASEAEASRDVWWRNPALWVAVGVVVTVLLEVAAVAVLAYVSPG